MAGLTFVAVASLFATFFYAAPTSSNVSSTTSSSTALPTVDLGYVVQQATINTGNYYNFSNIRYAAPPTGNLRFAAPVKPTTINRTLNDGQQGSICAQASPYWEEIASYYLQGYGTATLEYVEEEIDALEASLTISGLAAPDPRTTEDCLFLDVIVPESIYTQNTSAPVLVWVYGGGYVNGDKTSTGNPATLIASSTEDGGEGVVYVAMNYRLGLFGWLSGSTFAGEDGIPNAALYDQRLAFEWVQENIHLFGGDPTRVTVIGESAGAGSIMHQITAYGGAIGSAPFSQAILQSPGFPPVPGDAEQEATFQSVLTQAQSLIASNITDVAALRDVDFDTLAGLNTIVVARSAPYGTFTFGPVVDGTFVPAMPGKLLLEGKFDSSLNVMVGHNSDEGLEFTSPFLTTEALLEANLEAVFPTADNDTITYMLDTLWPAVYDGTYPYTTLFERASLITAEVSFTCNTRYLDLAFDNLTHAYYFNVPPGLHGEDIAYTFFNSDTTTSDDGLPVNATVATTLQKYITNFAMNDCGDPNGDGLPFFPLYQSNSTTMVIGDGGIGGVITDTTANDRCGWLMQALYA
ncbi:alpha/beta-hydrolase [Mollisia scopiformis]|uniref:Carboxylic ester hydrolase n=1 Tax=Mollisia scopiformis TaxID=149040 RepID=A0A132BCP6_MOLSC|nr:alpha/beta-hydrolase [Mollisia scopiformis]KUJ09769.1 alpha/beta-hydrolase [Mollisia scopiformis]